MIDAGYVNFSGENEDEEFSVKVLRLVFLVLGLLLITLPFNTLVRQSSSIFLYPKMTVDSDKLGYKLHPDRVQC